MKCAQMHCGTCFLTRVCVKMVRAFCVCVGRLSLTCTVSFYFKSSVKKNSRANVIKVSAPILKLVSFSPFNRRDGNKPEKINILLVSGMAVAYMYEHCVTIKLILNHKKSNWCQAIGRVTDIIINKTKKDESRWYIPLNRGEI